MRRLLLATSLVIVTAGSARAEDFEHVLPKLATAPAAVKAWLDGCVLLVTPRGEVRRPCQLTVADLVGPQPGVTLTVAHAKLTSFPRSTLSWQEADVDAHAAGKVIATFHVIEIGTLSGNPDGPTGGWWPAAQLWSRRVSDKDALAQAKAGKLTAPTIADYVEPVIRDDPQAQAAQVRAYDEIKQAWTAPEDLKPALAASAQDGAIIIGSAGERLTGKAGAKALRAWKLGLRQHGGLAQGGNERVMIGVTTMLGTTGGVTIPYLATLVHVGRLNEAGDTNVVPALIIFSVPLAR
jgi:hypothetical protein